MHELMRRQAIRQNGGPVVGERPNPVRERAAEAGPAVHGSSLIVTPVPPACKAIAGSLSSMLSGEERLRHIAEQIEALPDKERIQMRMHVEQLVRRMLSTSASDIDAGGPACRGYIWYRIDGEKHPDETMGRYSADETNVLFLNILSKYQTITLFDERSVDFSYQLSVEGQARPRRFRATCYFDLDHLGLNMRAIGDDVRPMKSLGFHPLIEKGLLFKHVRDGLTLITGVTGSGKSTTMDSVVNENNQDVPGHIIVIGRPIEYMHESKQCIVRHREVGKDVPSFKEGIVQALRQDPDMVVIGEMRDPETISAALEITDSGHKVFSTLHTSSAVESIDRIIAEYPPAEQQRVRIRLADVLRCIVSQKLLPKLGGGRVLAKEVLWMTSSARAAIKNENTGEIYQMMWEGWGQGQITLEQDLFRLVRQGKITPETAMDYSNNKRRLQTIMK